MPDKPSATSVDDRPEGLQQFVATRLVRAIVSGTLRPGEKLSPAKIADGLGVSHIPVREALAAMEAVGHVKRVPRVGFFVAELSAEDVEDIYRWRQILEDEAHRIAVVKLEDSDLSRMRKINAATFRAVEHRHDRFLGLNREYHFIPFERTGSEILLRFLNQLWDAAARYQNTMAYVRVPRSLLRDHHEALMEAFEARDAELVNVRMAEHRQVTLQAMRKMVGSTGNDL